MATALSDRALHGSKCYSCSALLERFVLPPSFGMETMWL